MFDLCGGVCSLSRHGVVGYISIIYRDCHVDLPLLTPVEIIIVTITTYHKTQNIMYSNRYIIALYYIYT